MDKIEIRVHKTPFRRGVELYVAVGDKVVDGFSYSTLSKGYAHSPCAMIDNNAAQALVDDLWAAGYRPTEGSGSAGSLRATENHLSDMRKIVAKTVGVDL